MIQADEAAQLDRIAEAEVDFYAQVLFLTLVRAILPQNALEHTAADALRANALPRFADAVISSFKDINERIGT